MSDKIYSFKNIEIKENTLVICDIDNTILHFPNCIKKIKEIIKSISDDDDIELPYLLNMYKLTNKPEPTDFIGFSNLLNKLENNNGKLIFLTARTEQPHEPTKKHLNTIGIDSNKFEIYYTNNKITKGEFIKNNIDLSNWSNIIFIDDFETNINSVINYFPEIKCYQFCIKTINKDIIYI